MSLLEQVKSFFFTVKEVEGGERPPAFIIDPDHLEVVPDDYDLNGYGSPKPREVTSKKMQES